MWRGYGNIRTSFLADDAGLKTLSDLARGEVEALAPPVLVEVRDERVELVHEVGRAQDPVPHPLARGSLRTTIQPKLNA